MNCRWDPNKILNGNLLLRELLFRVEYFFRRLREAPYFVTCPKNLNQYYDDLKGTVPVRIVRMEDMDYDR